ncbi:MAG: hypothetical protein RSB94_07865 [Erysipelotrichaceae bacterium]
MNVFGIFVAVSFIGLIITLVVMNIIKRINYSKEYTPYSEYYDPTTQDTRVLYVDGKKTNIKVHNDLQERVDRKSFGLTKERAERISLKTEQAYLDKYSIVGNKCDHIIVDDFWCQREVNETQEKYLETLPHHKTRVKNRSKRQRKK